jgi:hypothetical protein
MAEVEHGLLDPGARRRLAWMSCRQDPRRPVNDEPRDRLNPAAGRHRDVDELRWLTGQAMQLGRSLVARRRFRPGT